MLLDDCVTLESFIVQVAHDIIERKYLRKLLPDDLPIDGATVEWPEVVAQV